MEIISIHLMLLLNDNQNVETTINESNFNTSYVVIKPFNTLIFSIIFQYYNTSYVVIKQAVN